MARSGPKDPGVAGVLPCRVGAASGEPGSMANSLCWRLPAAWLARYAAAVVLALTVTGLAMGGGLHLAGDPGAGDVALSEAASTTEPDNSLYGSVGNLAGDCGAAS